MAGVPNPIDPTKALPHVAGVACTKPGHGLLGEGSDIALQIFTTSLWPSTIYDQMGIPAYKTYDQVHAHVEAMQADLEGCSCPIAQQANVVLNTAWAMISGGPGAVVNPALGTKRFHDTTVLSGMHVYLNYPEPGSHTFTQRVGAHWTGDVIRGGVEGLTRQHFLKIRHGFDKPYLPIYAGNSFWFALALAMYNDMEHWMFLKRSVEYYYDEVMNGLNFPLQPPHPRRFDYGDIDGGLAWRRMNQANTNPVDTIFNQLAIPLPRAPGLPVIHVDPPRVTCETWQVVADALNIELNVVISRSSGRRGKNYKPLVQRGNHNSRQIFLYMEDDGTYVALRPTRTYPLVPAHSDPQQFRIEDNVPKTIYNALNANSLPAHTTARANWLLQRSPFIQVDIHERPIGPLGMDAANAANGGGPPVGVMQPLLQPVPRPLFMCDPPDSLMYDHARYKFDANELLDLLNNGQRF